MTTLLKDYNYITYERQTVGDIITITRTYKKRMTEWHKPSLEGSYEMYLSALRMI